MTYLLASFFFALVFIGAALAIHLTVRHHWLEIVAALRGELGLDVTPVAQARIARAPAGSKLRAAA